jgi:hypothetical protein
VARPQAEFFPQQRDEPDGRNYAVLRKGRTRLKILRPAGYPRRSISKINMARVWKEKYNCTKHRNHMFGEGCEVDTTPDPNIIPKWVYFVSVCQFIFEFHSIVQIETCLKYFSQKIRPSQRMDIGAADHWEMQRWFEQSPQRLLEEPKRLKVMKALNKAIYEFRNSK